jgi:hypothetical protein
MKPSILIVLILFSSGAFSQAADSFKCPIRITIHDKSLKGKIHADDCKALLVIDQDTIVTHPDSIYNIQYPPERIKLIICYKGWTHTINCDKYLKRMYSQDVVYIAILLHHKNKEGGLLVSYDSAVTYTEEFGGSEKSKHWHNVSFRAYPETIYPLVK